MVRVGMVRIRKEDIPMKELYSEAEAEGPEVPQIQIQSLGGLCLTYCLCHGCIYGLFGYLDGGG